MNEDLKLVGALAGAGLLVGLGKLLTADEPIKARQVVGRAILSGATGLAAGAVVIFIPGIGIVAQIALACIMSSLGASSIEAIFSRIVRK